MGNRLSKITTKTGDSGTTGLGDGSRCAKDDSRIEALGTVDELNSWVGSLIQALSENDSSIRESLVTIQHRLFDLGGELSIPGYQALNDQHITDLEQDQDALLAQLPPLKEFILPGGSQAASTCHITRTVCRRAERRLVSLASLSTVNPAGITYLNRLSDYLFNAARCLARQEGASEIYWQKDR